MNSMALLSAQTEWHTQETLSGVLTSVALNYHEVTCIELALMRLRACIFQQRVPKGLSQLSLATVTAHWRYLLHWFNQADLKRQCRLDGTHVVAWPVRCSEILDWLWQVCQACLDDTAIILAASDAARREWADFVETDLASWEHYIPADEGWRNSFRAFQRYYTDIVMTTQTPLIKKLQALHAPFKGMNTIT